MTKQECNLAIEKWMGEISEEPQFLTKRKEDAEKELQEFLES
jgi:hypothetical protein